MNKLKIIGGITMILCLLFVAAALIAALLKFGFHVWQILP